ncbi:MAG TPA: AtpZ/AtpI family protein [Gemmatimonadota bacterium]|nr:AtpZ/AtpI family protein [Gemmatimonadota bacterium]
MIREVGRYTGLGLTWALSVLFFLLIGYWLDGKLGTLPWLTIAGAFAGAAGGFVTLYRGLTAAEKGASKGKRGRRVADR